MPDLVSVGGKLLNIGGKVPSFMATPNPAGSNLVISYYNLLQDLFVDLAAGHPTPYGEVKVSGANWRSQTLWENGHLNRDGSLATAPVGMTGITGYEILHDGFADNPSYYTGRTLVVESDQGKFKDASNNTIGISSLGATLSDTTWHEELEETASASQTVFTLTNGAHSGADWNDNQVHVFVDGLLEASRQTPTTDYTVSKSGDDAVVTFTSPMAGGEVVFIKIHRHEYEIDTAGWGGNAPRAAGPLISTTVGNASVIEDWGPPRVFFKDEEADYRDRFNNPRKMLAPWFRNFYGFETHMRFMDVFNPMRSDTAVPAEMASLTDATISGQAGSISQNGFDYEVNGGIGHRQSNPILPLLDYCKNEHAHTIVPWINMPVFIGMPVHATTESTSIQTGGSTQLGYVRLREDVVDFGQTITLDSETVAGVATLDLANNRVVLDAAGNFSHTTNSPNTHYKFTISFTDVEGNAQTYTHDMRVIWSGSYYYWWVGTGDAWVDNETYYDNHWAWDQWADFWLDNLKAANWSETDEIYLEYGNEIWNNAAVFAPATGFSSGCGTIKNQHESNFNGCGWISAKIKKAIDDRITARTALAPGHADYLPHSYNITMIVGLQTAVGEYGATSRFEGYSGFFESAEGGSLTGAALDAKMGEIRPCIANYHSGAFQNNGAANYTGLSDATHHAQVQSDFDADPVQMWSDVYNYYAATGAGTDDLTRMIWFENRYNEINVACTAYKTGLPVCYEGMSHDDNIPSEIKNYSGFWASYIDEMYTKVDGVGAQLVALNAARLRALDPNIPVAVYWGQYEAGLQPWAGGQYQKADNGYTLAVKALGV